MFRVSTALRLVLAVARRHRGPVQSDLDSACPGWDNVHVRVFGVGVDDDHAVHVLLSVTRGVRWVGPHALPLQVAHASVPCLGPGRGRLLGCCMHGLDQAVKRFFPHILDKLASRVAAVRPVRCAEVLGEGRREEVSGVGACDLFCTVVHRR